MILASQLLTTTTFETSLGFYIIISTKVSVINNKLPLPLDKTLFQRAYRIYIFLIYIYLHNFSASHHNSLFLVPDGMEIAVFFLEFSEQFPRIALIRLCLMQALNSPNSLSHSPWYFLQNNENCLTNWGQPVQSCLSLTCFPVSKYFSKYSRSHKAAQENKVSGCQFWQQSCYCFALDIWVIFSTAFFLLYLTSIFWSGMKNNEQGRCSTKMQH